MLDPKQIRVLQQTLETERLSGHEVVPFAGFSQQASAAPLALPPAAKAPLTSTMTTSPTLSPPSPALQSQTRPLAPPATQATPINPYATPGKIAPSSRPVTPPINPAKTVRVPATPAASALFDTGATPPPGSTASSKPAWPPPPVSRPEPVLGRETKLTVLAQMDETEVKPCRKCELHQGRIQTVFGEGDVEAKLMFIGEGPGQNEDEQGRPFVGRAGELLNKQIAAMGLQREQVYIANVVKCRPPENRAPTPIETTACYDYLRRQILTIRPMVIVTLGGPATKTILNTQQGITSIRGLWHLYQGLGQQAPAIPVMPTFHPAYLLRAYTQDNRQKVWSDLKKVLAFLQDPSRLP